METHVHPVSKTPIDAVRIGPGATLREGDMYDSSSGKWEQQRLIAGCKLEAGCETIWLRPQDISAEAYVLLAHLTQHEFLLTETTHWKVIPTPRWARDTSMDWRVADQGAPQELIDYGYVALLTEMQEFVDRDAAVIPIAQRPKIFALTSIGRERGNRGK